jgi:hypothetical protein
MLLHLLFAVAGAIAFPGADTSASPDGRFQLHYRAPEPGFTLHRLLLVSASSRASSQVYAFGRHVSVLWAPDSRHAAITDWTGSNESRVVIAAVAAPSSVIVLHRARIQAATSTPLARDHHLYVEASRWLSGQELLLVAVLPFLWFPRVLGPALAYPGFVLAHFLFGPTDAPGAPNFLAIFGTNAVFWSALFLATTSAVRFGRRRSHAA